MRQRPAGTKARKSGNEGELRHLSGQNTNRGTQGHRTDTTKNSTRRELSLLKNFS